MGQSKANRSLVMDVFSFVDFCLYLNLLLTGMVGVLCMSIRILICFLLFRRPELRYLFGNPCLA